MRALTSLPDLKQLVVVNLQDINGSSFRYFTSLNRIEILRCCKVEINGYCDLIEKCNGIEKIEIAACHTETPLEFLKCAGKLIELHCDKISLKLQLDEDYLFTIAMDRKISLKLDFNIFEDKELLFNTSNEKMFLEKVAKIVEDF